jgi:hypothetical protein
MLGDRGQDVNGEPVGLREVDRLERAFHQRRHERNVAGEPV